MTEQYLIEFCEGKELDWRNDRLLMWLDFREIKSFTSLMGGEDYFCEGGLDIVLMNNDIVIDLAEICRDHYINPEIILKR